MDYEDLGFETEESLLNYLTSLRDRALVNDESNDVLSSFIQDISSDLSEVCQAISGAEFYCEFISNKATNELPESEGIEVEATIISPELAFWYPNLVEAEDDEELEDFWNYLRKNDNLIISGREIVLNQGIDSESNQVLSKLIFDEDAYESLKVIPVGFPTHGLNWGEVDLSEEKFVYRLFGKISAKVATSSASEAKEMFSRVLKESFSFIDSNEDVFEHEFANGQTLSIWQYGKQSWERAWLVPIEFAFVNVRYV